MKNILFNYILYNSIKSIMKFPVYNDDEPAYMYLKKIEEYNIFLKKDEYISILDFVNKLGNSNLKSLCDFKNITLNTDYENNNKILLEYGKILIDKLKLDFDFDNLHDSSIIDFIEIILNKINYSIEKKKKKDIIYYSIVNKQSLKVFKKKDDKNKKIKKKKDIISNKN